MRILITSDIFPPDVGGPATYVPRIATALMERGHHVTVVTYSQADTDPEDHRYPFAVVRIPLAPPQWRRILRTLSSIVRHGADADIIYANGLVTEAALANWLLRKALVAKVVGDLAWERSRDKGWIDDDIDAFQQVRYGARVELLRWRRTWTYQQMQHTIVPSGYLRDMLVQSWRLSPRRVSVIYNAYEGLPEQVKPEPIALETKQKLITVCRLTSWKGVDGLIALLTSLPDVGLVIVGDGPLRDQLEEQAEILGVRQRVLFAGTVARARVQGYLKACDVFVLNSTYEGLPHVILEAAAAGLPVVATNAGGTAEVMHDYAHGQLVPVGDASALHAAIIHWLGRPKPEPATLPVRFSHEQMVHDTEKLLQNQAQGLHR